MRPIRTNQLLASRIPRRGSEHMHLVNFALSFDGYVHWGDDAFDKLEYYRTKHQSRGRFPTATDDLRGFLFMLQRAHRHAGGPGQDFPDAFYDGLEELRRRVAR